MGGILGKKESTVGIVKSLDQRRKACKRRALVLFAEDWEDIEDLFSPIDADCIARDIENDLAMLDSISALTSVSVSSRVLVDTY